MSESDIARSRNRAPIQRLRAMALSTRRGEVRRTASNAEVAAAYRRLRRLVGVRGGVEAPALHRRIRRLMGAKRE